MKRKIIPMSIAEFELTEHPFGWKAEYWDGQAHFTPREAHVSTRIALEPRVLGKQYRFIPVQPAYAEQMVASFYQTFADSVEFCDWASKDIQVCGEKRISRYFAGSKGEALPASVLTLEAESDRLAGVALFILNMKGQPELDLLYVRPPFQRQGVGTAIVAWGVNCLIEAGYRELSSAYHICNEVSRQWHYRFGFRDIEDWYYVRLKCGWLQHEIWRRQQLGLTKELEALNLEYNVWKGKLDSEELDLFA
jgi:GNAT superfamily N-acetyltransferase